MNPNGPAFSQEQMVQMMQMLHANQGQQGVSLPNPNNPIPVQAFHPGIVGLQMQPGSLPAMWQIQAQQQQNQFNMAGLLQNSGNGIQFQFAPNTGIFPSGNPSQRVVPGGAPVSTGAEGSTGTTFSRDDEDRFATTLLAKREDVNFGDILDSLDGVNSHSKIQWLQYYMRNSTKIERKMKQLETAPSRSKTSALLFLGGSSRLNQSLQKSPKKLRGESRHGGHAPLKSSSSKKAGPSLQSPSARPLPTSRIYTSPSPTPPRRIVQNARGDNKFTTEDVIFLKKFLLHALKHDSDALESRTKLCKELAERAPQHSTGSWSSYLRRHESLIASVRRRVLGHDSESESDDSKSDDGVDTQELDEDESMNSEGSSSDDEMDVSLSSSESEGDIHAQDIKSQSRYLPSERRALAKYIANITEAKWDNSDATWLGFQRKNKAVSVHSWKEWFSRNKSKDVMPMVRRFEIRNKKREEAGWSIKTKASTLKHPVSSFTSSQTSEPTKVGVSTLGKRVRIQDPDNSDEFPEHKLAKRSRRSTETPKLDEIIYVKTSVIVEADKEASEAN